MLCTLYLYNHDARDLYVIRTLRTLYGKARRQVDDADAQGEAEAQRASALAAAEQKVIRSK